MRFKWQEADLGPVERSRHDPPFQLAELQAEEEGVKR